MNKEEVGITFLMSCLTTLVISVNLFVTNVVVFFIVLVLYLESLSDDEFDDLDND